jgi:hypothetical protein
MDFHIFFLLKRLKISIITGFKELKKEGALLLVPVSAKVLEYLGRWAKQHGRRNNSI